MRLLVGKWLDKREISAYELAKQSRGRISQSAAYRLARGEWKAISSTVLDALCDVLKVKPGDLFERD